MQNEIFSKKLYEPLFEARPDMINIIKERVIAVAGDLVIDRLGIDPQIR